MEDKFEESRLAGDSERSLLDQLLQDSRLYRHSRDYKDLLDFVVRLRNFAPFNAMLLQIQKPGLSYAASAKDWLSFRRKPKEAARPLLILWPFGPVALVYDVQDTEGDPLPEDVSSFVARGDVAEAELMHMQQILLRKNIEVLWVDSGDRNAGLIRVVRRASNEKESNRHRIHVNRNHPAPGKFATLVHELAHLFLGHLGLDEKLKISSRPVGTERQRELEAESVAYIVCLRNGVTPKSQAYLANYVDADTNVDDLDIYQVMRAAGQIEVLLGLSAHAKSAR